MKEYFERIRGATTLSQKQGSNIELSTSLYILTGKIISDGLFCQKQIQKIIYSVYGSEVHRAGHSIKGLPSPKSRLEFLNSYNNIKGDKIISTIFKYAKELFLDVYALRNSLVHDCWSSSEAFKGSILLSSLDEEARLLFASGKVKHVVGMTTEDTYKAIIRYIENIKVVKLSHLLDAMKDLETCNWCLMQIDFCINENDETKLSEFKRGFLTFKGVSHLFPEEDRMTGRVVTTSNKKHSIKI